NARIMGAAHVENAVNLACRTALVRRQPCHVTMPVDLQSLPVSADMRSERNIAHHVSVAPADIAALPTEPELDEAARLLDAGTRVCILAGRGALRAKAELAALAESLP